MRIIEHSGRVHLRGGTAYPIYHGPASATTNPDRPVWRRWQVISFYLIDVTGVNARRSGVRQQRLWVYFRWLGAWTAVLETKCDYSKLQAW